MLDETKERYNVIVDMVESCSFDLLDFFNIEDVEKLEYDDLFSFFNQRLSYFALEVLCKFSQNH